WRSILRSKCLNRKNRREVVDFVNRKKWWHVPPCDKTAYAKRGQFLASSFAEAEFWGRPLDEPQKVMIAAPLVGDGTTIEEILFGSRFSSERLTIKQRWKLDARMKRAALANGHDSILL